MDVKGPHDAWRKNRERWRKRFVARSLASRRRRRKKRGLGIIRSFAMGKAIEAGRVCSRKKRSDSVMPKKYEPATVGKKLRSFSRAKKFIAPVSRVLVSRDDRQTRCRSVPLT